MRTSLRLPDEMAEKIRERAASERRSMHAMILLLLEEALRPPFEVFPSDEQMREHYHPRHHPPESDLHFKPDFKK